MSTDRKEWAKALKDFRAQAEQVGYDRREMEEAIEELQRRQGVKETALDRAETAVRYYTEQKQAESDVRKTADGITEQLRPKV